jgi:hypothetical protein
VVNTFRNTERKLPHPPTGYRKNMKSQEQIRTGKMKRTAKNSVTGLTKANTPDSWESKALSSILSTAQNKTTKNANQNGQFNHKACHKGRQHF